MHWLINGRPAPVKLVKDNLDPTDGLMSFPETRRTPSSHKADYISSNSSLSSLLPFKAQTHLTATDDLSTINIVNVLPLRDHSYNNEITHNNLDRTLIPTDIQRETVEVVQQNKLQTEGLERTKKSSLMSPLNDNKIVKNAQLRTNGFINRRGARKGLVTSSLLVGAVQRKNVDTVYTCLASNSNMTQASRAAVKLQMNRK